MRPPTVDLDDDHHPDGHNTHDQLHNCRNTQHPARCGAWGDNISSLTEGHVRFVFQNVNGLSSSTGIHDALKSKMVELQGTVTALAETNVNWKNFTFRDNWETLLQRSYSTLHFSHSSCDDGHHRSTASRTSGPAWCQNPFPIVWPLTYSCRSYFSHQIVADAVYPHHRRSVQNAERHSFVGLVLSSHHKT